MQFNFFLFFYFWNLIYHFSLPFIPSKPSHKRFLFSFKFVPFLSFVIIICIYVFPWGKLFSQSLHFLITSSSVCMTKASWTFLCLFWHVYWCWLLLSSCPGSHVAETLWVWLLTSLGNSLTEKSLIFLLL